MIIVDRKSNEQIYRQLYRQIRAEIETGIRQPNQVMPSTRFLAGSLQLSRNTIDHAYQDLVAEGYLISRPGASYRVAPNLPFVVKTSPLIEEPQLNLPFDFTETYDHMQLFPFQAWQKAQQQVFDRGIEHIQPANGDKSYRHQLVAYLARLKHINVDEDQIVVTSGFNEAAQIIARLTPTLKNGLAVAEPMAPNARLIWRTLDVPTVNFRDVTQLPNAAGYVLSPTHNFPTGTGLSGQQRQVLAQQLKQQQRYLIELDTDGNLTYSGEPIPAIHHYLAGERCFYYTNFDEVLGSSLCMGILVIPTDLVDQYQKVYGHLPNRNSQLQQQILNRLIANDDLERFMRQLTIVYANRHQLLINTVQECLGDQVEEMGDLAGSFVTLKLHFLQSTKTLIQRAEDAGVGLVNPDRCWQDQQSLYSSVVLSLRQVSDQQIIKGIHALAMAWQQK